MSEVWRRECEGKREMKTEKKEIIQERAAGIFFALCAAVSVFAVFAIGFYTFAKGLPALGKVGFRNIFLGTVWRPTGEEPEFGILYIILTSAAGTILAAVIGVPMGILTAVYLSEISDAGKSRIVRDAVEVLAGIPSVIYGLLGVYLLNPAMYRLERKIFAHSDTHRFTGGANLLSAATVLAVMMLPTVIHISETAIRSVGMEIRAASAALGATKVQTIFCSVLPAARPGIIMAVVLGVGRAVGEAMAITLVSGGSVNAPFPFSSVRFLATAIVSEMGYSQGLHRQMLFTIALVLFGFLLLVNLAAKLILKGRT